MNRHYKVLTTIEGIDSIGDKIEVIVSVVISVIKSAVVATICKHEGFKCISYEKITPKEYITFKGLRF